MALDEMTNAAEALAPSLSCFRKVHGCLLKAVWEATSYDEVDSIQLDFDFCVLGLTVDPDNDTIQLAVTAARVKPCRDASRLLPWSQQIGKPFGWGWVSINQQGYLDSVSLGFDSVTPQLTVTAIGSALRITKNLNIRKRHEIQAAASLTEEIAEAERAAEYHRESVHH
jgi:hypothetical protein